MTMTLRSLRPLVLIASLVANGFLGGVVLSQRPLPHPQPPRPGGIIEQMTKILTPADAAVLKQAADEQGLLGDAGPEKDFEEFHRRTSALMLADPFDVEAFRQLIAEFTAKREQAGDRIGKTLIQALPQMSAQGRHALANLRPAPPGPPPTGEPGEPPRKH